VNSLRGKLLIAGPPLRDPNFHRTVVLVCEHSDEGAMGLVLNRAAPLTIADAVPDLGPLLGDENLLHLGGPVQPGSVVMLAEFDVHGDALIVDGDLGIVTAEMELDDLIGAVRRARAFLGYAGWGPGQLDEEMEREDWIVAPLDGDDPFTEEPGDLWVATLERLGGHYALVARMPTDPSVN